MYTKQQVIDLYEQLSEIPFLDLGPIPNFTQMQQEALSVFESPDTHLDRVYSKNKVDDLYLNLEVKGLFDYEGLPNISSLTHSFIADNPQYRYLCKQFGGSTKPTAFSDRLPTLRNYLQDLFGQHPGRCRFSVLRPHTNVGWHTHFYDDRTEIVFHIAFQTDPGVLAQVGPIDPTTLKSIEDWNKEPETIYNCHFNPGRLWIFNARHAHRFINPTTCHRVHMWGMTWLLDADNKTPVNEEFTTMLENAEKSYTGIRMPRQKVVEVDMSAIWK
ncbi:hypothetical protein EBT25_01050 [bacterium]|jgi:hypothetical protein|nr:hypothetical protein [bacterium]